MTPAQAGRSAEDAGGCGGRGGLLQGRTMWRGLAATLALTRPASISRSALAFGAPLPLLPVDITVGESVVPTTSDTGECHASGGEPGETGPG